MIARVMGWLLLAAAASAQKAAPATGVVSGTVICGDTQLPARFTKVSLVRKPSAAETKNIFSPDRYLEGKGAPPIPETIDVLQERSGMDGSYSIRQVPPGDYWVVAKREGYVFPISFAADRREARDLDRLMAGFPAVHVQADRTEKADVTLLRGGTITGRVLFADGLPAVDWEVWLVPEGAKSADPSQSPYNGIRDVSNGWRPGQTSTDDEGRFRMAGLPPGKYVVATQLDIETGYRIDQEGYPKDSDRQRLLVFGPGVFSRAQARQVEIHASEVVNAADLKIDLSQLHTIRGRVLTLADRQPIVSGRVTAIGEDVIQQNRLDADGTFHLDYLPPGTYRFSLVAMFLDPAGPAGHYEPPPELVVVVGDDDVTLDDFLLREQKPAKGEADHAPQ